MVIAEQQRGLAQILARTAVEATDALAKLAIYQRTHPAVTEPWPTETLLEAIMRKSPPPDV